MTDQPKALRIAQRLEEDEAAMLNPDGLTLRAARLLREQHEMIERLRAQINLYQWLRNVCSKPSDAAMGDKP